MKEVPRSDKDLYKEETTFEEFLKRWNKLMEIAHDESLPQKQRDQAWKRLEKLIDLYVEFID